MDKKELIYTPPQIIILELLREDVITASEGDSNKQQDAQPDFFSFFGP